MRISAFMENVGQAARDTGVSLPELLGKLKQAGLESLYINYSWSLKTREEMIEKLLNHVGLPVEGLWDVIPFHTMSDEEAEHAYTELIDCAAKFGAKHLLITPGMFHSKESGEKTTREEVAAREPEIRRMIEAMRKAKAYGDSKGVAVTLEDYDGFGSPIVFPEVLRRFFEEIPGLQCSFDTGNFVSCDADVMEEFQYYRNRIAAVHLKDRVENKDPDGVEKTPFVSESGRVYYPAAVGSGDMHISEIVRELTAQRYDGAGIIELFGSEDITGKLFKSIRWMKENAKQPLPDEVVPGQICVGVIGSGMISEIYLKNMLTRFPNLKVKAVASRHVENARKRADQFGIACCTVEEMLADPEIQMIVNLTPLGVHYDMIRRALAAGKHVYTEKTITDHPETAKELLALAKERGLYLGGAPDTFLGAACQTAKAALDAGKIGEVTGFSITASRNWEILMNILPFLREKGPGMCYDFAVYHITALVSLLGAVDSVAAFASAPESYQYIIPGKPHYGEELPCQNETRVSASLRMRSGVTGTLMLDGDSISRDETIFRIYGTRGMLELGNPNDFGQPVRIFIPPADPRTPASREELPFVNIYSEDSRGLGVAAMAKAILQKKKNPVDAELLVHVLEILTAILESSEKKKFVEISSELRS